MAYDFHSDPILAAAFQYWQGKRGERRMPRRGDIEPSEIVPLLPNLLIIEVLGGGKRQRYRLVGTAIVEAFGVEFTGKYLDQVFSREQLRGHVENYRIIAREKCTLLLSRRYRSPVAGAELICHRLIMPLSEDGRAVNQMLTAMSFHAPNAGARRSSGALGDAPHFTVIDSERTLVR
ncbi:MAG: PAS domain-containing protein [Stellaceae bacterium]